MIKKFLVLILSFLLITSLSLFLTSCGGSTNDTDSDSGGGTLIDSGNTDSDTDTDTDSDSAGDTDSDSDSGDSSSNNVVDVPPSVYDVDKERTLLVNKINREWQEIILKYPEAETLFEDEYSKMLEKAQGATTKEDIESLDNDFTQFRSFLKEASSGTEFEEYKEHVKRETENEWEALFLKESFTDRYEDVLSAIDASTDWESLYKAFVDFKTLVKDLQNLQVNVDLAKQVCIDKIEQKRIELMIFEDKLTTQQKGQIDSLIAAFNSSETVDEVYENQQKVISYLNQLLEQLLSSSNQEAIQEKKTYLLGLFITKRSQISKRHPEFIIEFGTAVSTKETTLSQEIENATTLTELNAIESEINNEYVKLLEEEALNYIIEKVKGDINAAWNENSSSASEYEQLKNQILYVVNLCKTDRDITHVYSSVYLAFKNALEFPKSEGIWNEVYSMLVDSYMQLFEPQVTEAVCAKLQITDIMDYIKETETLSQADERFNKLKTAYESLQGMVYVVNAKLSEDVKIEIKVGSSATELINEIISKVKVVIYYSDETTKSFSLTSGMITVKDVDFTKVDQYFVSVNFKTDDYSCDFSLGIFVIPDMAGATVLGSYRSGELFSAINEDGIVSDITMTLYNNGYLKFSSGYQGYFAYTFKENETYIEVNFGKNAVYGTVLFEIEKDEVFDYYKPTGEPVMEFNGWFASLPTYIYVYSTSQNGTYTSAGKYIAICSFNQISVDGLNYVGCATYCTFDKENKEFTLDWIKSSDENVVYTWEDGSNELKEDLRKLRDEAKSQIQQKWDALKEEGYDVSYWETNGGMSGGGYNDILNKINMATGRNDIESALSDFDNLVNFIKNNRFYKDASPNFDTYSFSLSVNDDIESFINDKLVGKTFDASLEFGGTKTITITKEMVTYYGDPKTEGSVQFIVTYHDELYGDTGFSFNVTVMPSFEFGA